MREEQAECHARVTGHVRGATEMCSHDPTALHPTLNKANGKNPCPQQQSRRGQVRLEKHILPAPGGRLKFFKDGKFILELSHRRDGERTTWFPVPKKTFWPPASTTPNRQESSTSLSVSDDNSSIQSSPWQRDHCWKQALPRRGISCQLSFYYRRDPRRRLSAHPHLIARKRRKPLDPISLPLVDTEISVNAARVSRRSNGATPGKTLAVIVDKLARLLDPNVVSPRKRILRELERVTLGDQASKRRATPRSPTAATHPSSPKQLSSYSITSILGEDKPTAEPGFLRTLLRPEDRQAFKYSSSQAYPRTRMDTYLAPGGAHVNHPVYGVSMLPPGSHNAPLWVHYPPLVHYPPPIPLYAPSQTHRPSPTGHHYKDYREETLTPPSDMPLNLSKHAG